MRWDAPPRVVESRRAIISTHYFLVISFMLHAVIMAGGFGTRFWPLSRGQRPKQLLPLSGSQTMIQATVERLGRLVAPDRVWVMTNQSLVAPVAQQLSQIPRNAILGEPCKRDTAPCIGWAAALIQKRDPDATLVVMPSDHVIRDVGAFQSAVGQAVELVAELPQRIVTFGIKPTYPAEIFGYIERGERISKPDCSAFRVLKFREKPPAAVAKEYLASGRFYWNSGIFVWKAKTILDALAQHQPEMFARLQAIVAAEGTPQAQSVLETEFAAIRGISIDFAVMEHATDVAVIEAPFDWDDVGGWQSFARLHGSDENGNTIIGRHLGLNTTGSIVRSEGEHLVVTLGLRDCLIVHTPDATLVANKHDEEAIRQVVKLLEEQHWTNWL